jgi:two-component system response regulator NreC
MAKTKVLIADNHDVVRIGLRTLLLKMKHCEVVGEVADLETTADLVSNLKPDVVVLDLSISDGSDPIRMIKRLHPSIKVLIYTNDNSEESFFESFHSGAAGYLLKTSDSLFVIEAVDVIRKGELFFGPHISELMLKRFLSKPHKSEFKERDIPAGLTKREAEILSYIAMGMTNKEIAEKLFISFRTVNAHRNNLMQKLNVHGTADLVRFAIDHGLVTTNPEHSAF